MLDASSKNRIEARQWGTNVNTKKTKKYNKK